MSTKRPYRRILHIAGQRIDSETNGTTFNGQRTVETQKAGYKAQYKAEGARAKFTRKQK